MQRTGNRIRCQRVMIIYTPNGTECTRVGLTVSRKVGNAVIRNRVKRWLREAIRQQFALVPQGFDAVVIAHPQAAKSSLQELQQELNRGWQKMDASA